MAVTLAAIAASLSCAPLRASVGSEDRITAPEHARTDAIVAAPPPAGSADALAHWIEAGLARAIPASPGMRLEFDARVPDPRLIPDTCAGNLTQSSQGDPLRGRLSIELRCDGPAPWRAFVPVAVRAFRTVLVSRADLARGHLLSATDLEPVERDVATLGGRVVSDLAEVEGQVLARNLRAGQPVPQGAVTAPVLVRRGERVTLAAGVDGLVVTVAALALGNGQRGQQVAVRNLSSERTVQAWVVGRAAVSASGPGVGP